MAYLTLIQQAKRRLTATGKQAKYPLFYSVQPLVDVAIVLESGLDVTIPLLLQLRLINLMRLAYCAKLV